MAKRNRIRSLSLEKLEMNARNITCVSVTRTDSARHVDVEVRPVRRRVSKESAGLEKADACALAVRLIFTDLQGHVEKKVELDECFDARHVQNVLIDVHTLLAPVWEHDVDVDSILWHLFSVMIAGGATLQIKLCPDGENLVFFLSYGSYESEAVVSAEEWGNLFVVSEDA